MHVGSLCKYSYVRIYVCHAYMCVCMYTLYMYVYTAYVCMCV